MFKIVAGEWYLVVKCQNPACGKTICLCGAPFDETEEEIEDAFGRVIEARCRQCGTQGRYRPRDVMRGQAQLPLQATAHYRQWTILEGVTVFDLDAQPTKKP